MFPNDTHSDTFNDAREYDNDYLIYVLILTHLLIILIWFIIYPLVK